jgi:MscS family membrane protein
MSELNDFFGLFSSEHGWIIQVFLVVLVVLVLDFIQRRILRSLLKHAEEKTKNIWDDAVLHSARRPITIILWMLGLTIVSQFVHRSNDEQLANIIGLISHVGIIIAVTWFASEFIAFLQHKFIAEQLQKDSNDESRVDSVTIEALCKLLRLTVILTSIIVILETLGFSLSGVLAFGGIGGIAIGFAAKDLLSNFFGGLMIYLDRPFAVGDWVRSTDREIEGTVEYIGWRQTRIRAFSKRPIYVPNAIFSTIVVENPSRMTHRRIHETLGIRYDDIAKMEAIVSDVKAMLQHHSDIDASQALIVNFNAFAASSVDFFIYTMTKTTNWFIYHDVKQDVLLQVAKIVESHGAEFAFPTSTLHIANETPELAGLVEPKVE